MRCGLSQTLRRLLYLRALALCVAASENRPGWIPSTTITRGALAFPGARWLDGWLHSDLAVVLKALAQVAHSWLIQGTLMKDYRYFVALALTLLFASITLANATPNQGQGVGLSAASDSTANSASASQEPTLQIALLKQQLAATKTYQDSLLATVYWALGGVFVIAGLLVGFGWFANFKIYERDKIALKAELLNSITASLKAVEERFMEQFSEASKQLVTQIDEKIAPTRTDLTEMIEEVNDRIFEVELDARRRLLSSSSTSVALTHALKILELCIERKPEEIATMIKTMIDKIGEGGKFTAKEMTRVNAVLDRLPPRFKTLVEKLSAKMVASELF